MISVQDLLALLDRWPAWKRVKEAPARIDELERRIAALEQKPHVRPDRACPYCQGGLALVEEREHPDFGAAIMLQELRCDDCGKTVTREFHPN